MKCFRPPMNNVTTENSSTNTTASTISENVNAVRLYISKRNSPSTGSGVMPERPSLPPVTDDS